MRVGGWWWRKYERAARHLPDRLMALVDLCIPGLGEGWGVMNGQQGRQKLVRDIVRAAPPQAVIETGTYRGTTTRFLAAVAGVPVFSAEVSRRYADFARFRLRREEVTVTLEDSRAFLRRLADDPAVPKSEVLFYLDAHWYEDLPLRDELRTITDSWTDFVVLIDDFRVDDDYGYEFEPQLTLNYLQPSPGLHLYWPTLPGEEETGWRRGLLVLSDQPLDVAGLRLAKRTGGS